MRAAITSELRRILPPGTEIGGALGYMVDQFTVQFERAHKDLRVSIDIPRTSSTSSLIIPLDLSTSTEPNYAAESWAREWQAQFQALPPPEDPSSYYISRIAQQHHDDRLDAYRTAYTGVDYGGGPDSTGFFATSMRGITPLAPTISSTPPKQYKDPLILAVIRAKLQRETLAISTNHLLDMSSEYEVLKKRLYAGLGIPESLLSDRAPLSCWERLRKNYALFE